MDFLSSKTYSNSLNQTCVAFQAELSTLNDKDVMITGATGMIGGCFVDLLTYWNLYFGGKIHLYAVSRNRESAEIRFSNYLRFDFFSYLEQDVCCSLSGFPKKIDYIVHAASNGDPVSFAKYPVDTLLSNVLGTKLLLDYGISAYFTRFLFVSSGEVYGKPNQAYDDFVEEYCGPIDLASARSCYPEGKRAAEVLCQSYISQYRVNCVIARPCHIFGPTMTKRDTRAVSEFFSRAATGLDIELKSSGLIERSHCYVLDAISALLCVLTKGECAMAYNIADPFYQMTIRAFAEKIAKAGNVGISYKAPDNLEQKGYSKIQRSVLSNTMLLKLGWNPMKRKVTAIEETLQILHEGKEAW